MDAGTPVAIAVSICQREYEQTHSLTTGAFLADRLEWANDLDGARRIATGLVETTARGDGLYVLGEIAIDEKRFQEATTLLKDARTLHRANRELGKTARDSRQMSRAFEQEGRYGEALQELDDCIKSAQAGSDVKVETECHLAASKVLSEVGYFELAAREIDVASKLTASDNERMLVHCQRGDLFQENIRAPGRENNSRQATVEFEQALAINERVQAPRRAFSLELNLATSYADFEIDKAEQHLLRARSIPHEAKYQGHLEQVAALIADQRRDRQLAFTLYNTAYYLRTHGLPLDSEDRDDLLDISVAQARIALADGDLSLAQEWAQNGIEQAEHIRDTQSAAELRPWVLGSRRLPYELRFVALARAAQRAASEGEKALLALDKWQGRTMLDKMAPATPGSAADLRGAAAQLATLGRWLPAVSAAPFAKTDQRAVQKTLPTIDLLALVVADGDIWRVTASHGQLQFDKLGTHDELKDRLTAFKDWPTEPAPAGDLGELILAGDTFRSTDDALHVLLDNALPQLSIAALRRNGQPLINVRPVIYVERVPDQPCVPALSTERVTVLADSKGDLSSAREEGADVAQMFHTEALFGKDATSKALFAAARATVLHVAGHAGLDRTGGGELRLYDRDVSALEISASKLAPAVVVLSACGSARAADPESVGSLATAFLIAGSTQVVATTKDIDDPATYTLARRFYQSGGAADPARTLARIQAELAKTSDTNWPRFAVFGRSVCSPRLPATHPN